MEKEIKIKISSKQFELSKALMDSIFNSMEDDEDTDDTYNTDGIAVDSADEENSSDLLELTTEGYLRIDENRVEIIYSESELTGMEGANTNISFDRNNPTLITMLRGGSVTTAMVFEAGVRHICVYETPIMPFELCVHTLKVENQLLENGMLYLDYLVEFKGAQAERTKFTLSIEEKTEDCSILDEYDNV